MRQALKTAFAGFVKFVAAGIIVSLVVVVILAVAFSGSSRQQQETLDQQAALLSAIGCELGVPAIDGVRDPQLLRNCWTDEGLIPPAYFEEP